MSQITLHLKFPLLSMIEEQSLGKYPTRLKRNNFIQGRPSRRMYVVPRNLHKRNICRAVSGYCPPSFKAKNQDLFFAFCKRPKNKEQDIHLVNSYLVKLFVLCFAATPPPVDICCSDN